ncbi:MAG TPA: VOC family protein [Chryseosolibacter sp.]|nr:VOC family protein [Chryseosolibacter sp.]
MKQRLVHVAILVRDYDEAIEFYTKKLGFELIEDTKLNETKRWVVVRPKGEGSCGLLLAKAVGEAQTHAVGNQSGGRVFLFLHTDDFERDYGNLRSHNIVVLRGPVDEPYGRVAVFKDLYGNQWDLIQPKE